MNCATYHFKGYPFGTHFGLVIVLSERVGRDKIFQDRTGLDRTKTLTEISPYLLSQFAHFIDAGKER